MAPAAAVNADTEIRATLVALLRRIGIDTPSAADLVEDRGPRTALQAALGGDTTLFVEDPEPLIARAGREITRWRTAGLRLTTVLDVDYPDQLRTVHDRPALLFSQGDPALVRNRSSIAVVGSRHPSVEGVQAAGIIATELVRAGHVVVSGLATGIDAVAHRAAMDAGGRTVGVIGTGHEHTFPPDHAGLQAELARHHAVVSPFWPEARASAANFRRRNGLISGLSLGTVIVEASARSGTRVLARLALAHGRPLFLRRGLLTQPWALELAERPGVHVIESTAEVLDVTRRLREAGPLIEPATG